MRISDWSSDVCSSDLGAAPQLVRRQVPGAGRLRLRQLDAARIDAPLAQPGDHRLEEALDGRLDLVGKVLLRRREGRIELRQRAEAEGIDHTLGQIGRASRRERGGKYG